MGDEQRDNTYIHLYMYETRPTTTGVRYRVDTNKMKAHLLPIIEYYFFFSTVLLYEQTRKGSLL
jgi:hypothetical protein